MKWLNCKSVNELQILTNDFNRLWVGWIGLLEGVRCICKLVAIEADNMKTILSILFVTFSMLCKADGIDRIHVYLNGELIYMTENYQENREARTIKVGDTLLFDAWTDWDMLDQATLNIQDKLVGINETLNQEINNKYGAQFIYIIKEQDLEGDLDVILNYNIPNFTSSFFLSISKGTL